MHMRLFFTYPHLFMYSIEDTWREWQKWRDDLEKFTDWLNDCQRKVKFPNVEATYVVLKREQANFEVRTPCVQSIMTPVLHTCS